MVPRLGRCGFMDITAVYRKTTVAFGFWCSRRRGADSGAARFNVAAVHCSGVLQSLDGCSSNLSGRYGIESWMSMRCTLQLRGSRTRLRRPGGRPAAATTRRGGCVSAAEGPPRAWSRTGPHGIPKLRLVVMRSPNPCLFNKIGVGHH